jgi:ClpP class serine protease
LQLRKMVEELLGERMAHDAATALANKLTTGTWTHDYGITSEEAKQLGLPISTDMPQEVYDFMALFRQLTRVRSAVEYVPSPYRVRGRPVRGASIPRVAGQKCRADS